MLHPKQMLPLNFLILGVPISSQASTRKKREWREKVGKAARLAAPGEPVQARLHVELIHYFFGGQIDLDSLAKPVLDALKEIIYDDDSQVDWLSLRRQNIQTSGILVQLPPLAAGQLASGTDFLLVSLRELDLTLNFPI